LKENERIWQRTVGSCNLCDHKGYLRDPVKGLYSCKCRIEYYQYLKWRNAGIPPNFCEKTISDYTTPHPEVTDAIVRYIVQLDDMFRDGIGLYMWGDFGVGKSGLAVEILKEALRRGKYEVAFMFWPEVMKKLTAFDEVPADVRAETEKQLLTLDFVVIDDVGREYRREGSNWVSSNVDSIFRQRMHLGVPTILTSNFSMEHVRTMYGDSLASVFRGNLVEVRVEAEKDHRPSEGAEKREKLFQGMDFGEGLDARDS